MPPPSNYRRAVRDTSPSKNLQTVRAKPVPRDSGGAAILDLQEAFGIVAPKIVEEWKDSKTRELARKTAQENYKQMRERLAKEERQYKKEGKYPEGGGAFIRMKELEIMGDKFLSEVASELEANSYRFYGTNPEDPDTWSQDLFNKKAPVSGVALRHISLLWPEIKSNWLRRISKERSNQTYARVQKEFGEKIGDLLAGDIPPRNEEDVNAFLKQNPSIQKRTSDGQPFYTTAVTAYDKQIADMKSRWKEQDPTQLNNELSRLNYSIKQAEKTRSDVPDPEVFQETADNLIGMKERRKAIQSLISLPSQITELQIQRESHAIADETERDEAWERHYFQSKMVAIKDEMHELYGTSGNVETYEHVTNWVKQEVGIIRNLFQKESTQSMAEERLQELGDRLGAIGYSDDPSEQSTVPLTVIRGIEGLLDSIVTPDDRVLTQEERDEKRIISAIYRIKTDNPNVNPNQIFDALVAGGEDPDAMTQLLGTGKLKSWSQHITDGISSWHKLTPKQQTQLNALTIGGKSWANVKIQVATLLDQFEITDADHRAVIIDHVKNNLEKKNDFVTKAMQKLQLGGVNLIPSVPVEINKRVGRLVENENSQTALTDIFTRLRQKRVRQAVEDNWENLQSTSETPVEAMKTIIDEVNRKFNEQLDTEWVIETGEGKLQISGPIAQEIRDTGLFTQFDGEGVVVAAPPPKVTSTGEVDDSVPVVADQQYARYPRPLVDPVTGELAPLVTGDQFIPEAMPTNRWDVTQWLFNEFGVGTDISRAKMSGSFGPIFDESINHRPMETLVERIADAGGLENFFNPRRWFHDPQEKQLLHDQTAAFVARQMEQGDVVSLGYYLRDRDLFDPGEGQTYESMLQHGERVIVQAKNHLGTITGLLKAARSLPQGIGGIRNMFPGRLGRGLEKFALKHGGIPLRTTKGGGPTFPKISRNPLKLQANPTPYQTALAIERSRIAARYSRIRLNQRLLDNFGGYFWGTLNRVPALAALGAVGLAWADRRGLVGLGESIIPIRYTATEDGEGLVALPFEYSISNGVYGVEKPPKIEVLAADHPDYGHPALDAINYLHDEGLFQIDHKATEVHLRSIRQDGLHKQRPDFFETGITANGVNFLRLGSTEQPGWHSYKQALDPHITQFGDGKEILEAAKDIARINRTLTGTSMQEQTAQLISKIPDNAAIIAYGNYTKLLNTFNKNNPNNIQLPLNIADFLRAHIGGFARWDGQYTDEDANNILEILNKSSKGQ